MLCTALYVYSSFRFFRFVYFPAAYFIYIYLAAAAAVMFSSARMIFSETAMVAT